MNVIRTVYMKQRSQINLLTLKLEYSRIRILSQHTDIQNVLHSPHKDEIWPSEHYGKNIIFILVDLICLLRAMKKKYP